MGITFKSTAPFLLAALLSACATSGSGGARYLSEKERSVLLAAYQDPVKSGNLEGIASWVKDACQGTAANERPYLNRCHDLSDSFAYILANQGKYAEASKYLRPTTTSEIKLWPTTFIPRGLTGPTPSQRGQSDDRRLFDFRYLNFLISDGMGRDDAKEHMYDAYLRSSSFYVDTRPLNPLRYVDTPIRPFNLSNFPKDAERLDSPAAARQAEIFLSKIYAPLRQAAKNIHAQTRKFDTVEVAQYVALYEHAINEAQKLNLDARYINFLGDKRKDYIDYAKTVARNALK